MAPTDLAATAALWIPALGFLLVLLVEVALPNKAGSLPYVLTLITLAVTLLRALQTPVSEDPLFGGRVVLDSMSLSFVTLLVAVTLLVVLVCEPYCRELRLPRGEIYALLLASLSGMLVVAVARDFLVLFLGIELLSIPLYVLAGFRRLTLSSVESGFKYFLFGAFASGFLIYGIALLYGAEGSTLYQRVGNLGAELSTLHRVGFTLLMIGLAFKVAAAPFHTWAPDVYQGAPTPVTAFMAACVKVAGFAALLRLALEVLPPGAGTEGSVTVLAGISMVVGNLGALLQTNLKRMIAYSSIAHAGYLLVGITAAVAGAEEASAAVRFYLWTYSLMTVGSFAVLLHFLRAHGEGESIHALNGLSRSRPYLAFGLALCFLSLAGIPFTAGFFGKLFLLRAAWSANLLLLSVILILGSVISLYYYLRVVVALYMKSPEGQADSLLPSAGLSAVSLLCGVGILVLGLYPQPLIEWIQGIGG